MTENGQAMLNEYIAEINEQFEDDTTELRLSTAKWVVSYAITLLGRMLQLSVLTFTFIAGMAMFIGNAEFIAFLQQGAADEVYSSFASAVAISVLFGMLATALYIIVNPRHLRETPISHREVIDSKNVAFMTRAITIHEGVLIRHGLIETEGSQHG